MSPQPSGDPIHLIEQMAQGDAEAFGRFYDRYAPLVFGFALRLLRERADAEDLLQEVFLQVWREAGRYSKDRGSPEAWIVTMTRSRGIDRLRAIRRKDRSLVPIEEPVGEVEGRSVGLESEARLTVLGALASIPESQRKVLELAYFDGLTQSEIAARLEEPLGTVKTRMRTGIGRLRGLLGMDAAGGLS